MEPMVTAPVRARLLRAVYLLAAGTESLQERLSTAWLELMPLRRDDLPVSFHEAFGVIEAEMLGAPDEPEALSDEAAIAAVERIFGLMVAVTVRPAAEG